MERNHSPSDESRISSHTNLLGYACGVGAKDSRCCMGPLVLEGSDYLARLNTTWDWVNHLFPHTTGEKLAAIPAIASLAQRLANYTASWTAKKQRFAIIGGDHSSAIGTWTGVRSALNAPLGLIWIDAHMDANTPETTPSGCIHGMPLACLLGFGDNRLMPQHKEKPILLPTQVYLVGVRSYDKEEAALLDQLKVKVYYMPEIKKRGLTAVLQEAIDSTKQSAYAYGVSLDIDAIDPLEAPGTGYAEPDGIQAKALCEALANTVALDPQCIGVELAEFNPALDQEKRTERLLADLLVACGF